MYSIGKKALNATKNKVNSKLKNKVLDKYISLIIKNKKLIIKKNFKDIKYAKKKKLRNNLIERLTIDEKKINDICYAIKNVKIISESNTENLNELFDNERGVLVMAENLEIRNNRLNLLCLVRNYSLKIADFRFL